MSAPDRIYIHTGDCDDTYYELSDCCDDEVDYIRTDIHEAEITALKAEIAALKAPPKVLSAEEVTEPGFYWSSCGAKSNHWVPVWVLRDRPNSLYYAFPGSAADYSLKGLKFIGPIQTPEV